MRPIKGAIRMPKMVKLEGDTFTHAFQCPGCGNLHGFDSRWTWNGDEEKPTISPSILVYQNDPTKRCHSFVRDGMIQFLSDCGHALVGQTVPLEDI